MWKFVILTALLVACAPKEDAQRVATNFSSPDGVFAPDAELCGRLEALHGSWRDSAKLEINTLVLPGGVRVFGRTNLPDGVVLFAGVSGLGGWEHEHVIVKDGGFTTPMLDVEEGEFLASVELSGAHREFTEASLGGAGGIEHLPGGSEFLRQTLVGAGPTAAARDTERRALRDELEANVREMLGFGRMALKARSSARGAVTRCMKKRREIGLTVPAIEARLAPFAAQRTVFNHVAIAGMPLSLSDCTSCLENNVEKQRAACARASASLESGDWAQSDPVLEYRRANGLPGI